MRTSSISSYGSPADDVMNSLTAGSTHVQNLRKEVNRWSRTFASRFVQILVQSRMNESFDAACNPTSKTWFDLEYSEVGEISAQIKKSLKSFPPEVLCTTVEFYLYTCEGEILPLEAWNFSIDTSTATNVVENIKEADLYRQLGTLLKTVSCASRMTPMHRYYVKKQSAETFVILYKLTTIEPQLDLGKGATHRTLGTYPSVNGTIKLTVAYRTRMEIDRVVTPNQSDSFQQVSMISPGTTPDNHISGTPMSFCEDGISHYSVSPPSAPLGSPASFTCGSPKVAAPLVASRVSRSRSLSAQSEPDSLGSSEGTSNSPKNNRFFKSQMIPENMPFANLLAMSYTGTLYPLQEENHKEELVEEEVIPEEHKTPMKRNDSFQNKIGPLHFEEEAPKPLAELDNSSPVDESQRTIVPDSMGSTLKGVKKESKQNLFGEEDEDDSFVKIPMFGGSSEPQEPSSNTDELQLANLMSDLKATPEISSFVDTITAADVLPNLDQQMQEFALNQCIFDKFLSDIRDMVENEE